MPYKVEMLIENATSTILSDIDTTPSPLLFYHRVVVPAPYSAEGQPGSIFDRVFEGALHIPGPCCTNGACVDGAVHTR